MKAIFQIVRLIFKPKSSTSPYDILIINSQAKSHSGLVLWEQEGTLSIDPFELEWDLRETSSPHYPWYLKKYIDHDFFNGWLMIPASDSVILTDAKKRLFRKVFDGKTAIIHISLSDRTNALVSDIKSKSTFKIYKKIRLDQEIIQEADILIYLHNIGVFHAAPKLISAICYAISNNQTKYLGIETAFESHQQTLYSYLITKLGTLHSIQPQTPDYERYLQALKSIFDATIILADYHRTMSQSLKDEKLAPIGISKSSHQEWLDFIHTWMESCHKQFDHLLEKEMASKEKNRLSNAFSRLKHIESFGLRIVTHNNCHSNYFILNSNYEITLHGYRTNSGIFSSFDSIKSPCLLDLAILLSSLDYTLKKTFLRNSAERMQILKKVKSTYLTHLDRELVFQNLLPQKSHDIDIMIEACLDFKRAAEIIRSKHSLDPNELELWQDE